METLQRISATFEKVKSTIKNKSSSEKIQCIKKDLQIISTDLIVLGKENHEQHIRSLAMEAYLALLSSKTLPLTIAEKKSILNTAFIELKPYALREECLFIFLRIQNLLCFTLIQLEQIDIALDILENMESIYDTISKTSPSKFLDAEDLFTPEEMSRIKTINPEKVDRVITNNIQMQAFLYNKLNLQHKFALYNHTALRRQLEMKEGTPQDWALRAARLGNYFTYLNQLGNARHHLCAAYHVLRSCHDNCKLVPEEFVLQKADFEIHFLELSHHWVKYGLNIFKISKKKVLNRYFTEQKSKADLWKTVDLVEQQFKNTEKVNNENEKDNDTEKIGKGDCPSDKLFAFPSLSLNEIEKKVPVDLVSNETDARNLFAFTHKWLMRTKHYYDFEQHSAQYISCSLQLAELFEHLAFFERDIENQYSIQKRRAEVLETLNSLLKTCDSMMSLQIDVIKELSQVQLELMALNLQKLWREESKVNILNLDSDAQSIINNLDSESNKTLTKKTLNTSSRNVFLRKMEAATSMNGKLFRLSGQLDDFNPSQLSISKCPSII